MSRNVVPATPRVISPSPTPSETREKGNDGYFGPTTRSTAKQRVSKPARIDEDFDDGGSDSNPDLRRARSRSRSPLRARKLSGLTKAKQAAAATSSKAPPSTLNGTTSNGHLSPPSTTSGWSWRDFSRSPSPLGLIPIHRQWRIFIHRHEVPRKVLHVSIGFFALWLYIRGVQINAIFPWVGAALVPIALVDYIRFSFPAFNRFYVRVLGALMRETEFDGWNGVIWYLLGVWIVLYFFPKDVAVVSVLLLSWCDTAASTVGRAYGRYTPRIRKGKSVAGSLAAFIVGVATAIGFWGWFAPNAGTFPGDKDWPFMFTGVLRLPGAVQHAFSHTETQSTIDGGLALAVVGLWTGFVASASEVVDLFGWDDNLTIPVLSGIGIWGFLKVFG